jgi:helicase
MAHSADTELNPAQREVVERGLLTSGFNAVLQMPTGAGKTWLAEQATRSALLSGHRVIYLTPLRALANELVDRWRTEFAGHEVGVFTGEYGQGNAYPVPFERARLLVMTPERLDACTRNWRAHWGWLPEVALLVVDELHLLGESIRGARLEGALMRVRRLNPFLQVLGLSATLGNRAELADWLGGVHYATSWRPIPIEWRCSRYQRATDKSRLLQAEVGRCVSGGGQSLVFVQSRRRAESIAEELRGIGIEAGHHHAGLDSDERRRLEGDYRSGTLRALVSTGTLEMGLNLPARQVVLYDLQRFDGADFIPLTVNTVWQRAGRAGRRGLDTHGEVVLLAPSWDRGAERYEAGRFEAIGSGLSDERALAEQLLVEVSSGLARTRSQLRRNMDQSLAAHQRCLPSVDRVVGAMVESGMVVEVHGEDESRASVLKATRLGRIAVRQMLAPSTVVSLARQLRGEGAVNYSLFDLLLVCALTDDCEPRIPVDFDELGQLGELLSRERSCLLSGTHGEVVTRLDVGGRRLLSVIKAALVVRAWTRTSSVERVAGDFGCYGFEVHRLRESVGRILAAVVAVATPPKDDSSQLAQTLAALVPDDGPALRDRVRALAAMVAAGLDEDAVTLTFVSGVGGALARRLVDAGITDVEDLALAAVADVAGLRGVSEARAARWIDEAGGIIVTRSAVAMREPANLAAASSRTWDAGTDPYRLRRSLELEVRRVGERFIVTGGLEPHRVADRGGLSCDCLDHSNGHVCKHILAVRLHREDAEVVQLVERLASQNTDGQLDLFQLWFEGGQR